MIGATIQHLVDRILLLEDAIRKHRDQRGDDRCFMDDEELYTATVGLGDNPDRRLHCPAEMLENCKKYIASRHDPNVAYVSPQREIERLTEEIARSKKLLTEIGMRGDTLEDLIKDAIDFYESIRGDR